MSNKVVILIATTLLLAACGTVPQRKAEAPTSPPAAKPGGAYLEGDGPGANIPANIDAIPDAVPKSEPLHRYANRPYVALGKTYVPLTMTGTFKQRGIASWYGKKFNGERTSSGEIYDMYGMSAAHPTLPIPSYARVTNLSNQKSVIVRINDRGPFIDDRIIDLSYTAAHKLGIVNNGSAEVEVESIPPNSIINTITAGTVQSRPLNNESSASAAVAAFPAAAASAVISAPAVSSSAVAASAVAATASAVAAVPAVANTATADPDPAAPPLATAPKSSNTNVYLQLGAFKTQDAAVAYLAKMRSKLGSLGKQFKLTNKDGLVRVHIGPYASQSEARSSADSMESKLGFKPIVNLP
ncbi:MAG: Rare lipoprotein A [Candidatus Gallionella acididurans]|uniref:Endolytic peptidoglycan transglycosylase RlpA n=1 Tax=Candidatus Gallionella acididurans TaxID=1796491 RepID=A0A139BRA9_9PROT|nr:MAG: Rare lipoprotein A [Candidatus Gallionella acididurans]